MIRPAQTSTEGGGAGGGRLRTLVLGLEVWALAIVLPSVEAGLDGRAVALATTPLPLLVLAAGELSRTRWPGASLAVLCAGVPFSLAVAVAARPDLARTDAWGGALAPVLALSLLLYLAAVLHSFARPAPTRATGWQPLPEAGSARTGPARWLAAGLVGATLAAALVAVSVLPFAPSAAVLEGRFPLGSAEARTLAVAVGGGLFAVALGAILGPALRARRVGDPARERIGASVLASLGLAVLAALAYAWLATAS